MPQSTFDAIWYNANLATMNSGSGPYGLIADGAVGVSEGRIAWVGKSRGLEETLGRCPDTRDCGGRLVTPGLVDCHTHLIYAGERSGEFELRMQGSSYEDIANSGGGIAATVAATRAASEDELYQLARSRLEVMMANGVTAVEIKSGYGLDTPNELKMLRVGRRLGQDLPLHLTTTFLGAHAVPPEFKGRSDDYIELVCSEMLPRVAEEGLADAVDVFCEKIAFSPAQAERVFAVARDLGLQIKCHAEQLSNLGGAALAASYGAVSVDHLEYLDAQDVAEIAPAGTVAVLLPGAFYFLGETKQPPLEAMRQHGVPIAVASDSNPGSSPVWSMTLMLNMACTCFRLTPEEALRGATKDAARAIGANQNFGTIDVGKSADLVLWELTDPVELSYRIGGNPCLAVMWEGRTRAYQ